MQDEACEQQDGRMPWIYPFAKRPLRLKRLSGAMLNPSPIPPQIDHNLNIIYFYKYIVPFLAFFKIDNLISSNLYCLFRNNLISSNQIVKFYLENALIPYLIKSIFEMKHI